MRLRNVKDQEIKLSRHPRVITEPEHFKGKWREAYFKNDNPIHIEIGMGMGQFLKTLSQNNKEINYIGFEKFSKVLVRTVRNFDEDNTNVGLIRMDVEQILDVFEEGEVDKIYLNFSDPWPKDRYHKRRLTHRNFLKLYKKILKHNGLIQFKTDNEDFFDFSLEEFESEGWAIKSVTRDLHNSEYKKDNIMTEYEQKYKALGKPIFRLEAVGAQD